MLLLMATTPANPAWQMKADSVGSLQLPFVLSLLLQQARRTSALRVQHGGKSPRRVLDGRSACPVFPSEDVGAPWYAAGFIKYPEPVEIEGDRYSILALHADKDYFRGIIGSLHFISSARSNPPFLLTIASAHVGKSGATWKNDAAFPLLLTMKNSSEKVLHVALADPASDYRVVAMHKTERVRVTQNLPAVAEQSQGVTAPTRNVAKILKPTETCQDAIKIRFWADREAPGEYTLQVERDLPHELGKGLVESNTITVVVIH